MAYDGHTDEFAAAQRATVSTAQIRRAVALFDPVWGLLFAIERFRILHLLLLESGGYDGSKGELELAFYNPLGITSLAAEAAMIGQLAGVVA